ncbi:zinc-binding protein A33 isoform X1 [Thunnus maccoyii]|uniref:zinc-binding protein A33 isoform X1 n=1 Tax=Thunnus maccoyii TaxID=8240 RepID=UPI001C4A7D89|nr:zinc-binding protein A33 isoform X1 [Thunnus maccoyii]
MSLPEEDLTCPVCCDIFTDPVLLSCSHSFCRSCLKRCWDTGLRECPVCRKRTAKSSPPSNLALKNVCETLLQTRRQSSVEEKNNCNLHGEKLKLFCLVDKQPICVVCQSSKLHKTHDCSPLEEAVLDCKDELALSLKSLQDKLNCLKRIHRSSTDMFNHIKSQTLETQRLIKSQFEQLHQVLYHEESARLAAVKKEEEEKIAGMKDKFKELSAEVLSLTETIAVIQEELKEDDMVLLKNFKATQDRSQSTSLNSDIMSGLLIDVTKHLSNLKHRIWEKMLDHIDYSPVTLDPNTAHPCLILSDDLTSLHYSKEPSCCPDNPERFHMSAEVVGMTTLGSGSHHWVVETGSNQDWLLGVASSSVPRNCEISARPENGFWTLCFRDGEFRAMTSPPTPLTVSRTPQQVKVQLDYNKGTLSFVDSADDTLIYAFTDTFRETLLPYFYTQSSHPLRILPDKVLVTMLRQ